MIKPSSLKGLDTPLADSCTLEARMKVLRQMGSSPAFSAALFGEFDPTGEGVVKFGMFLQNESVELLHNPLAFECVYRNEPVRLGKFDNDILSVTINQKYTVAHYAAALGAVECLAVLIDHSDYVVPIDSRLLYCCDARFPFGNRKAVLELLLEYDDLEEHWDGMQSLLERCDGLCCSSNGTGSASEFGCEWMTSFVLSLGGGSVDLGEALIAAAQAGNIETIRRLLDEGADVNTTTMFDFTPLLCCHDLECLRLLVERGADVNAADTETEETKLMHACEHGDVAIARLMLENGADVNAKTGERVTALMKAAKGDYFKGPTPGHTACVRLLLEHGADVNVKFLSRNGYPKRETKTALEFAQEKGHTAAARLIRAHCKK